MECELCGEEGTEDDPIVEYHNPAWPDDEDTRSYAHAACGNDQHYVPVV